MESASKQVNLIRVPRHRPRATERPGADPGGCKIANLNRREKASLKGTCARAKQFKGMDPITSPNQSPVMGETTKKPVNTTIRKDSYSLEQTRTHKTLIQINKLVDIDNVLSRRMLLLKSTYVNKKVDVC